MSKHDVCECRGLFKSDQLQSYHAFFKPGVAGTRRLSVLFYKYTFFSCARSFAKQNSGTLKFPRRGGSGKPKVWSEGETSPSFTTPFHHTSWLPKPKTYNSNKRTQVLSPAKATTIKELNQVAVQPATDSRQ